MEELNSKKKSPAVIILVVILALALALGAYNFYKSRSVDTPAPEMAQTEETTPPANDSATTETIPAPQEPVVVETKKLDLPKPEAAAPSASSTNPEIVRMMSPRTIGNVSAPIKVTEFASLTCSHCGVFHRETFEKFKTDFIDTGKVQMTFKEFPLNQPALDASQILRCMPEDKYVSFMSLLFQEQDKWAFADNYLDSLRQNAKLAGISDDTFDACLANAELKEAIVGDMAAATQEYKVESTPSFVFNGGQKVLVGAQPIEKFAEVVNEISSATAAPDATTPDTAAVPSSEMPTEPTADETTAPPAE